MKKKIAMVMATFLALAFSASLAMASMHPASTHAGVSNGIYSCWGGGYGGGYGCPGPWGGGSGR